MDMEIKVEGLEELREKLKPESLLMPPWKKAFEDSVILLEREAKVGARVAVDTGRFRGSITHEIDSAPMPLWGETGTAVNYAPAIEYGRKPGKMPPVDALKPWARRHGMPESAAFAIARKIQKYGIKGKFIFKQAYEKSEARISRYFDRALDEIDKRFGQK